MDTGSGDESRQGDATMMENSVAISRRGARAGSRSFHADRQQRPRG
jgi:hypothetical protein